MDRARTLLAWVHAAALETVAFVSRFALACVLARALESALAVGVARARHNITVVDGRALETRASVALLASARVSARACLLAGGLLVAGRCPGVTSGLAIVNLLTADTVSLITLLALASVAAWSSLVAGSMLAAWPLVTSARINLDTGSTIARVTQLAAANVLARLSTEANGIAIAHRRSQLAIIHLNAGLAIARVATWARARGCAGTRDGASSQAMTRIVGGADVDGTALSATAFVAGLASTRGAAGTTVGAVRVLVAGKAIRLTSVGGSAHEAITFEARFAFALVLAGSSADAVSERAAWLLQARVDGFAFHTVAGEALPAATRGLAAMGDTLGVRRARIIGGAGVIGLTLGDTVAPVACLALALVLSGCGPLANSVLVACVRIRNAIVDGNAGLAIALVAWVALALVTPRGNIEAVSVLGAGRHLKLAWTRWDASQLGVAVVTVATFALELARSLISAHGLITAGRLGGETSVDGLALIVLAFISLLAQTDSLARPAAHALRMRAAVIDSASIDFNTGALLLREFVSLITVTFVFASSDKDAGTMSAHLWLMGAHVDTMAVLAVANVARLALAFVGGGPSGGAISVIVTGVIQTAVDGSA